MNTIMIVEDENIIALDIKNRLKKMGYEIISIVSSGEEALEVLKEIKPDLILMDIYLKGFLDGISTSEVISNRYNIPIIFITSYSDEMTLRKVSKVGSYGYLIKPFSEIELKYKVKQAFENYA